LSSSCSPCVPSRVQRPSFTLCDATFAAALAAAFVAALLPRSAGSAVQQQLRAQAQKGSATAPKVLVSVDEAETTAAQLQRTNSAKKQ
jgi:hypothetical protein